LRTLGADPQPALKGRPAAPDSHRRWLSQSLVILQVGLALVLSIGAGLMVKSLWRLQRVDPGFQAENLLTARLTPSGDRYATLPQIVPFYDQVLARIARLPGVVSVAAAQSRPMGGDHWSAELTVQGEPAGAGRPPLTPDWLVVTPGYFRTLAIPLLAGRSFASQDREGAQPVALVNRALARRVWPGGDPLGKRVYTSLEGEGHWVTVVGLVGDVRSHGMAAEAPPTLYRPHAQFERYPRARLTLLVRTRSQPLRLAAELRSQVWAIDPGVPVAEVETMESVIDRSIGAPRLVMQLLSVFANLALVLGMVSLYGLLSYSVSQRLRELGVRMALGARRRDVLGLVVGQALRLVVIGLALGLCAALGLTRFLQGQLFGVTAGDPATFGIAAAALLAAAVLASLVPARRAARADPMSALRQE
jgi:putative ABC transport system permease protein